MQYSLKAGKQSLQYIIWVKHRPSWRIDLHPGIIMLFFTSEKIYLGNISPSKDISNGYCRNHELFYSIKPTLQRRMSFS